MLSDGFVIIIKQLSITSDTRVWLGKKKTRFLMQGGGSKLQRHNTNVGTFLQPTVSEH